MESNPKNTDIEFIKALQESEDYYVSSDQYYLSDGKGEPVEEGRKIESMLQLAVNDLQRIQKWLADTQALFPRFDIRRDELEKQLMDMKEKERETQDLLNRIVQNRERLQKGKSKP